MFKEAAKSLWGNYLYIAFGFSLLSVYLVGTDLSELILVYGLYFVICAGYLFCYHRNELKETVIFLIPFWVMVLYFLCSLLWSQSPEETSHAGDRERFIGTAGFVLITTAILSISQAAQRSLSYIIVIIATLSGVLIILLQDPYLSVRHRLILSDYNPIISAFIYVVAAIMALYITVSERKFYALIPYILLSYVVFLTRSRGALLSLGTVSLFILYFELGLHKGRILRLAIAAAAAALASLILGFGFPETLAEFLSRADNHRFEIWRHAVAMIGEHLILGHGADAEFLSTIAAGDFPAQHPHNLMLGALFYGGIVGLALMAWVYKGVVFGLVNHRHEATWRLPLYLLTFFVIITLFDTGLPLQRGGPDAFYYWLPYAWASGWILNRRREQAAQQSESS